MLKGYLHALNWVVLVGFFNVFMKYFTQYEAHPIIIICQSMLFAGLALTLMAGKGKLVTDSLKTPHTWVYGMCYLCSTALFVYALNYITATQMSLLGKFVVPGGFILSSLFFKRSISATGWLWLSFILMGIFLVCFDVETNILPFVIFIVLIFSGFEIFQMMISDIHSTSNKAKSSVKDTMRVTGVVLMVTSIMALALCLIGLLATEYTGMQGGFLPTLADFKNPWSFVLASFYGIFGLTFIRYSEFVSTRTIKFEIFLAVTTLVSVTTYLFEIGFSHFGLIESRGLTAFELCGAILIVIGSSNAVYARALQDKIKTNPVHR